MKSAVYTTCDLVGGLVTPNDGQCHLNGTKGQPGYYTESKKLDYPSVSQINYYAQQVRLLELLKKVENIWPLSTFFLSYPFHQFTLEV